MTKYVNDWKKQQETLRGPFDIETHKQCFVDYLEVVIDEDGTVMYATPSHQEKMISMGCKKFNQSREEFYNSCPKEYWLDVMTWLCDVTGCVPLWVTHMDGNANEKQAKAIIELYDAGLYRGLIVSKVNPYK
ncbi:hypothetical protein [Bacillus bombysepticus]|uniref:hypothetical protein n=1 Tax=Bacillus bombysepticus TaxID=658666 RepID=UPI00301AD1BF